MPLSSLLVWGIFCNPSGSAGWHPRSYVTVLLVSLQLVHFLARVGVIRALISVPIICPCLPVQLSICTSWWCCFFSLKLTFLPYIARGLGGERRRQILQRGTHSSYLLSFDPQLMQR